MNKLKSCKTFFLLFLLSGFTNCSEKTEKTEEFKPVPTKKISQISPEQIYYSDTPIEQPFLYVFSPLKGETIGNWFNLEFAAYNVYRVDIHINGQKVKSLETEYPNHYSVWLPLFENPGNSLHIIELNGYDYNSDFSAYSLREVTFVPEAVAGKGNFLGKYWITYYYLSREIEAAGDDSVFLDDSQCVPLAHVPWEFATDVCVEGSGKLLGGDVINFSKSCDCGIPCPLGGIICYTFLDKKKFPWGAGSRNNALVPFRSIAVDNNMIPYGSVVYMPRWDGFYIPLIDNIGNFYHDGCFRADDVGGWIKGDHFDFFAGTDRMWLHLEKLMPTKSKFKIYLDAPRCQYLKN
ncbi:MAG: 3D domain-containing protein [Deltaproteobacteria bacterium]|jgi:3D (Asp-Asp-Asp) domain-containing protein|nr:3D domain-containing protein [Deltaproteobacteria bacterium]